MLLFRLFFAIAASSCVNGQALDHVTPPGAITTTGIGIIGKVIKTESKYIEDVAQRLKEKEVQRIPEWITEPQQPEKAEALPKKNKCKKKDKKKVQCGDDEKCVRIKVNKYDIKADDDDDDENKEEDGARFLRNTRNKRRNLVTKMYKPFCFKPCSKVCTGKWLKCGMLAEDPPAYPIWWYNFENQPCFQVERQQGTKALFIRTSCKCPTRDYTVSDSCTPGAGASLSNCVQAWMVQTPEINFQDLKSVQLGYVRSTGEDIDFQGDVQNSLFCRIDAYEDVEFGGGTCPATIQNNVFWNTVTRDKDFQFEEGTTVTSNIFFNVDINDDFEIKEEAGPPPLTATTTITNNYMVDVTVDDDCKIDAAASPNDIDGNFCSTFTFGGSGCDVFPFQSPGFSCL